MDDPRPEENTTPLGVLIVSADEPTVVTLRSAADTPGVRVNAQSDPASALKAIEGEAVTVLLLDADGLTIDPTSYISDLRARHPELFVIVTAAEPTCDFLIGLIRAGVHDFVSKPVDRKRLAATIGFLCGRSLTAAEPRVGAVVDPGHAELAREVLLANQQLHTLNKTLKQHVSQLKILYQMGRDISDNENWSDALDRFLMALVNYINAGGAALLLFSERESRLKVRANFQIDPLILTQSCQVLLENWMKNPRGTEIHTIESYKDRNFKACLERDSAWRYTIVPLRHRNRSLGFLLIDKEYRASSAFKVDYHFLTTIQTIITGEVANASYISELRQLGRFNQKVLDTISGGVITTDLGGDVLFYNERASAMCAGLSGPVTHFDKLFRSDAFGPDFFDRIMESTKSTHVLEVWCTAKDEREFPARLSLTKMHDDNLNGTVLVGIFEDLTDQKALEDEVRRNDRLRVLGQLSAGVAHEIRNPLTGIATSAEVLGSRISGQTENLKYIKAILDEINRLDEIIRNLLNFARPAKPLMTTCTLADLSRRVVSLLADEAKSKGIELAVTDDLEYPECIADANQLTQVLLNVVLNSIQACDRGDSVRIVMKNTSDRTRGRYARIDVDDTGPGVPSEVRGSLFEPFVTTKSHGTGLGLAVSQQIIEEHRGHIDCEFLDKGTRVTIRLPIKAREPRVGGQST